MHPWHTSPACLSLQVLDRLSSESSQLLDVLGATLHELTGLTAPIHSRATALTQAQRNIAAANAAVDELLDHLDTSRRVRPRGDSACCRAGSRQQGKVHLNWYSYGVLAAQLLLHWQSVVARKGWQLAAACRIGCVVLATQGAVTTGNQQTQTRRGS
jgi:hypothetical protein